MKKIIFAFIVLLFTFCKKENTENNTNNLFVGFKIPSNFPETIYDLSTNEITQKKFELGRKLFYDPILSQDNSISCGSCHQQSAAFTHAGHSVSHGIHDLLGTRNTPSIQNLAWQKSFMWDGGISGLDIMPIAPITNEVEMGENMPNILRKLKEHNAYPKLFEDAFNVKEISTSVCLKALSQFMLMLISSNSKYDKIKRNEGDTFIISESNGYEIFKNKCSRCHQEPLFTDQSFKNNGLSISEINDIGVGKVSTYEKDNYTFKVPSLRNVAITSPYMHDGRYLNLDAAIEHYNSRVQNTPNLDSGLKNNNSLGIPLSVEEKANIKAFLNTLTDNEFITDKRFSETH